MGALTRVADRARDASSDAVATTEGSQGCQRFLALISELLVHGRQVPEVVVELNRLLVQTLRQTCVAYWWFAFAHFLLKGKMKKVG